MGKGAGERFDAVRQRLIRYLDNHRPSFVESKNKGGRPPTWDWEGALIHVTAIANTPDGLPSERGAQARIEELIHDWRSEEHTSELQSLMRISYAVFCLTKKHTKYH